jgi:hypothetical protein
MTRLASLFALSTWLPIRVRSDFGRDAHSRATPVHARYRRALFGRDSEGNHPDPRRWDTYQAHLEAHQGLSGFVRPNARRKIPLPGAGRSAAQRYRAANLDRNYGSRRPGQVYSGRPRESRAQTDAVSPGRRDHRRKQGIGVSKPGEADRVSNARR